MCNASPCSDAQINSQALGRCHSFILIPYDQLQPYPGNHHPFRTLFSTAAMCASRCAAASSF